MGGHAVFRTRVVKATLNPVWNGEHCSIVVQDASQEDVEFICYDSDFVCSFPFFLRKEKRKGARENARREWSPPPKKKLQ